MLATVVTMAVTSAVVMGSLLIAMVADLPGDRQQRDHEPAPAPGEPAGTGR